MSKPWRNVDAAQLDDIPCTTGVYEIRDRHGEILDIGYAGSREPFGLKSKIEAIVSEEARDGLQFRYELHVQYMTRYAELVLVHRARHNGAEPARVSQRPIPVEGRLHPDTAAPSV